MSRLFQVLDCSQALGTCCTDYGLLTLLDVLRQVLDLIQLIAPIVLMVALAIQFTQLIISPDMTDMNLFSQSEVQEGMKKRRKLMNKFVAAVLCFLVPFLVNLSLSLVPEEIGSFQLGACWDTARISREVLKNANSTYVSTTDEPAKNFILTAEDYDDPSITHQEGGVGQGSATGRAIVAYAREFLGQPYYYGGTWNGEKPYTATDCSGFVQGVFKHFGIQLERSTGAQWADTDSYTLVTDNPQAGDLVMYDGHVAILTGNGEEIIHASNPTDGIKLSSTYKYKPILGIMRIKGVN